jgi:polyhydroxybutyrate depolymerase
MKRILSFFPLLFIFHLAHSQDYSIMHDGLQRTYRLHLPIDYNADNTYPLLFSLHGATSNGFQQEMLSGFNHIADQEHFIMVYPNGIGATWSISTTSEIDDVGFISALLDTLDSQYNINLNMVYASGMSMGGFMCYRLACELSDRISAIASVAGLHTFFPCNPPKPVPILQIHGTEDPVVPYTGVPATISQWTGHDGCPQDPVIADFPDINHEDNSTVRSYYYGPCNDSTEVILYSVIYGEHSWPGSNFILGVTNQDIDARNLELFQKIQSPGIDRIFPD